MRGYDSQRGIVPDDQGAEPPPPAIGSDERRMHVRAYNYWVSLLGGRAFPSIADLDPASLGDFGPNSVLLDFTGDGADDPAIRWLGSALKAEGGIGEGVRTIADVPGRSLLSRLTDHNLQIIANRAPIGFEAEFVNVRGNNAMYRGILMPFSSDGQTIDFIYGVINWKELADPALVADIAAAAAHAIGEVRAQAGPRTAAATGWADGPSRSFAAPTQNTGFPADPVDLASLGDDDDETLLADALALARESAEAVASSELRSREALYRAIAHAYGFACAAREAPEAFAELLDDAGLTMQARAPMTPIAKLVFGVRCDKTRLAEYAAALAHADRCGVAADGMAAFLDGFAGGLKGLVAAERVARRPASVPAADPGERLRAMPAAATVAFEIADEFVLLLARRSAPDEVAILGVADDSAAVRRAMARAARG